MARQLQAIGCKVQTSQDDGLGNRQLVAVCYEPDGFDTAKLFAAAPDLLQACKAVVAAWDQMDSRSLGETIAEARAAIARAEGANK